MYYKIFGGIVLLSVAVPIQTWSHAITIDPSQVLVHWESLGKHVQIIGRLDAPLLTVFSIDGEWVDTREDTEAESKVSTLQLRINHVNGEKIEGSLLLDQELVINLDREMRNRKLYRKLPFTAGDKIKARAYESLRMRRMPTVVAKERNTEGEIGVQQNLVQSDYECVLYIYNAEKGE